MSTERPSRLRMLALVAAMSAAACSARSGIGQENGNVDQTKTRSEEAMAKKSGKQIVTYVGTYTAKGSEGIYVYRYDPRSGALEPLSKATGVENPTFLAIHPDQRHLYAVREVRKDGKRSGGAVNAYAIDPKTGELTLLDQQSTRGDGPCHLTVDQTGKVVLTANYSAGSVTAIPIQDDGRLGETTCVIQHEGSSINPKRQKEPHAHSINLDPTNRYAFACDLGIDKILIYRLDPAKAMLTPNDPPWATVTPGAGPRHFTFHPNGRYAYVINELDNTLIAFSYDPARGALTTLQTISTLPDDFHGTSYCADVHISPSGKFLYGSNRGHNSIVICRIDEATGKLAVIGHEPTQGDHPRNFAIDPSGTFLLVANQNTDNIVTFRIDQETGKLNATGRVTKVSMPVCLKMLPLGE